MNRFKKFLTAIAVIVALALPYRMIMSDTAPSASADNTITIKESSDSLFLPVASPTTSYPTPSTTSTIPPKPMIFPLPIKAWGETIAKDDGTLTLHAAGTEAGDLPTTIQVNFDLCAQQDVVLRDVGSYDELVAVLNIPSDGTLMNDDYYDYTAPSVVIIDNTNMVNMIVGDGYTNPNYSEGDMVPVLRKGTCTTTSVEVNKADRGNLIFGFAYTTIPFGEFRVDGEFTRLGEGGASQISWEYWVNG